MLYIILPSIIEPSHPSGKPKPEVWHILWRHMGAAASATRAHPPTDSHPARRPSFQRPRSAEPLQPPVDRPAVDPQQSGGLALVPARGFQGLGQLLPLLPVALRL